MHFPSPTRVCPLILSLSFSVREERGRKPLHRKIDEIKALPPICFAEEKQHCFALCLGLDPNL